MKEEFDPLDHIELGATVTLRSLQIGDIVVNTVHIVETPERVLLIGRDLSDNVFSVPEDLALLPQKEITRRLAVAATFCGEQETFFDSIVAEFENDPRPIFHDTRMGGEIQIRCGHG